MKLLEPIPYGYVAYTGRVISKYGVDSYNAMTEKCNSFIRAGLEVPEHLLNGKHNLFVSLAEG